MNVSMYWPILLIVVSSICYQICAKSSPDFMHPLAVLVIAWLTDVLKMHALSFVLSQLLAVGLIALVVLFQPELRRMIDHMSNVNVKKLFVTEKADQEMQPVIHQVVRSCEAMSRERVGALIVFARDNRLEEYFKTGTIIDAQVSEQLIRNIFFP